MKITINYGNSANIPVAKQYASVKPFYNISWEVELPVNANKEDISRHLLDKAKALIDPMIEADFKEYEGKNMKKEMLTNGTTLEISGVLHKYNAEKGVYEVVK